MKHHILYQRGDNSGIPLMQKMHALCKMFTAPNPAKHLKLPQKSSNAVEVASAVKPVKKMAIYIYMYMY